MTNCQEITSNQQAKVELLQGNCTCKMTCWVMGPEWKDKDIILGVDFHISTDDGLGWCQLRGKIDWQEDRKFDCRLVRTIFIFCCPSPIFPRHWRVARKSNFDS